MRENQSRWSRHELGRPLGVTGCNEPRRTRGRSKWAWIEAMKNDNDTCANLLQE